VLYLTIFYLLVFLLDFIKNNYFIILFFTQNFFWLFFWYLNIFILSLNGICGGSNNFQRTAWSNLINHFNSVLSIVDIFFLFKIILICLLGKKWFQVVGYVLRFLHILFERHAADLIWSFFLVSILLNLFVLVSYFFLTANNWSNSEWTFTLFVRCYLW